MGEWDVCSVLTTESFLERFVANCSSMHLLRVGGEQEFGEAKKVSASAKYSHKTSLKLIFNILYFLSAELVA